MAVPFLSSVLGVPSSKVTICDRSLIAKSLISSPELPIFSSSSFARLYIRPLITEVRSLISSQELPIFSSSSFARLYMLKDSSFTFSFEQTPLSTFVMNRDSLFTFLSKLTPPSTSMTSTSPFNRDLQLL